MFNDKNNPNEIADLMVKELDSLGKKRAELSHKHILLSFLNKAAELLEKSGLKEEQEIIKIVVETVEDPATRGLTSDKMVKNLKMRGITLNLPTPDATDLPKEMKGKDKYLADDVVIEDDWETYSDEMPWDDEPETRRSAIDVTPPLRHRIHFPKKFIEFVEKELKEHEKAPGTLRSRSFK